MDKYKVKIILMDEAETEKLSAVITSDSLKDVSKYIPDALNEVLEALLKQWDFEQAIKDERKKTLTERTGLPLEFTLTGRQLQKWYDENICPEGYEDFERIDEYGDIDYNTGKYEGGGGTSDFEICLRHKNGSDAWEGKGGYWTRNSGYHFGDVKFTWHE